jgi:hypothetical protein
MTDPTIRAALDSAGLAVVDRADLGDVLDDLAARLYADQARARGPHPIVAHRYHRDMAPVRRLRAMLTAKEGER